MIARINPKRHGMTKTTLMTFRNLARKGTDAELEDFLYRVCQLYIADVRDTDFVDPDEYLRVHGRKFECQCPNCGAELNLDLEELLNKEEQK